MRARSVLFVVTVVALSACGAGSPAPSPVANQIVDGVTLLRHGGLPSDVAARELGYGRLAVADGCVAFGLHNMGPVYVLWPSGTSLRTGPEGIEVADGDGDLIAGVGELVQLRGAFVTLPTAQSASRGGVPEACSVDGERYFLAADPWPLAQGYGVTLLRTRDDRLHRAQALLSGTIGLRNGCVAIFPEGTAAGLFLLWPADYTVDGNGQAFTVRAPDGSTVARSGTQASFAGSAVPLGDPTEHPSGIPQDCMADAESYWAVGIPAA